MRGSFLTLSLASVFLGSAAAGAQELVHVSPETELLGKKLGAEYVSQSLSEEHGVETTVHGTVLGRRKDFVRASVAADPDTGEAHTEVFVKGLQLVTAQIPLYLEALHRKVTIAPMNVEAAILRYPVGPLILGVDAGFTLAGEVDLDATPTVAIPIEASTIDVGVVANVQSLAYAEGAATLLIFKAGIQGEVTVLDTDLQLHFQEHFDGTGSRTTLIGSLEALSGSVFAFFDIAKLFGFKWTHLWVKNFFSWDGLCYQYSGDPGIGGGKCASGI